MAVYACGLDISDRIEKGKLNASRLMCMCVCMCMMCIGETLNDSHAEVIARRAFVAWVWSQLAAVAAGETDVSHQTSAITTPVLLEEAPGACSNEDRVKNDTHVNGDGARASRGRNRQFRFRDDVRFHMCVSRAPCGACAGPAEPQVQREQDSVSCCATTTGTSVTRKPGRGPQTLSVSCSDKLVKWSVLGMQGSILMHFLAAPVYLRTLVIVDDIAAGDGADADAARARMVAAVSERTNMDVDVELPYRVSPPELVVISFAEVASGERLQLLREQLIERQGDVPSGFSIALSAGVGTMCHEIYEVTIAKTGRRAGTTKQKKRKRRYEPDGDAVATRDTNAADETAAASAAMYYSRKSCSQLAKAGMLARARSLETLLAPWHVMTNQPDGHARPPMTYAAYKSLSTTYQALWLKLRTSPKSPLCGWECVGGCAKRQLEEFVDDLEHVQLCVTAQSSKQGKGR